MLCYSQLYRSKRTKSAPLDEREQMGLFSSPQGDPWKMDLYVYKPKGAKDAQSASKPSKKQLKQQQKASKKRGGLFGR